MRFVHPRFTVRRLMVAVAILGLVLGLGRWLVVMRARSDTYRRKSYELACAVHGRMQANFQVTTKDGRLIWEHDDENFWRRHAWGAKLSPKYWRLANRPWLTAEPDPPAPERLARPRPAIDCPAELTMGNPNPCHWCMSHPWSGGDPVYPRWTFPWTWNPTQEPGTFLAHRYSFP